MFLFVDLLFLSFFFSTAADCPDAVPSSDETGGTNYLAPGGLSGKTLSLFLEASGGRLVWNCSVVHIL